MDTIKTKDDFINFVHSLQDELKAKPTEWENRTLDSYLEAIASWTEDMDNYYVNTGKPVPKDVNWSVFADILKAASMYE